EADLVLGGDEGKECTYSGGYLKRQAVFSCLTCVPAGIGGVCTACSLACHDGHEVVELWTKRKFRCDCGNSKFGSHICKLCPEKDPENPANSYNHNFKGSYCTCGRPYPDPEAEKQVEMIQCCICEDWFHEDHIGLNSTEEIARDEEGEPLYEDFICPKCSPECETCTNFYAQRGVAYLIDKEDSIEEYEKVAKQKREKKLEQQEGAEANFLNSLDHQQAARRKSDEINETDRTKMVPLAITLNE
ncbi:hypothetical protein E2562_007838, partial [Oryza meyeriana var. granulata]